MGWSLGANEHVAVTFRKSLEKFSDLLIAETSPSCLHVTIFQWWVLRHFRSVCRPHLPRLTAPTLIAKQSRSLVDSGGARGGPQKLVRQVA